MNEALVHYLLLPKGIRSILFKSYVYFTPFLYSLILDINNVNYLPRFLLIFILFEFVINPSRYQLNDVVDYVGDQQRQYHWKRPVNETNRYLVVIVAILRWLFGTIIAFFLDVNIGYIAVILFMLQFFYDQFAKKASAILAILTVSIAYPIRSMSVLYGLGINLDQVSIFILLSIFFYSTYMVIQWRKQEALFIREQKLTPKFHSDFFSSNKINFLISSILLALFITFVHMIISLAKIDSNGMMIIYFVSGVEVVFFYNLNNEMLAKIASQTHNIIIFSLFVTLTVNLFFISLAVTTIFIFIIFWYHKIYVNKFSKDYFERKSIKSGNLKD